MVKGVNKTVIEVNLTEHMLFERAILFVKPGADAGGASLQKQADDYVALVELGGMPAPPAPNPVRRRVLIAVRAAAAVAVGVAVGIFLF